MAFGVIQVTPVRPQVRATPSPAAAPSPVTVPVPPPAGGERVSILLVADCLARGEDFLCGIYFNLLQAAAGSGLSVYTRQFETVSRLSELKQQLEQAVLALPGQESVRDAGEQAPIHHGVLTLGRAGQASPSLDLAFTCIAPGEGGEGEGGTVIALLDARRGPAAARAVGELARRAAGEGSVVWVITGFEDTMLLTDPAHPPESDLRGTLRAGLELPLRQGDLVTYAQLYGGLELTGQDSQGRSVMRSLNVCRDYAPAACHLGVFTAAGLRVRECSPSSALGQLWPMIWNCFKPWSAGGAGWLENGPKEESHETEL